MSFITSIKNVFLDFLFPGNEATRLLRSLPRESLRPEIPQSTYIDERTVTLFDYRSPLATSLVWEIKYRGAKDLAQAVAPILFSALSEHLKDKENFPTLLVPIPISDTRRLERGWNQAEIIAETLLAEDVHDTFTYAPNILKKIRHTESQTKAGRHARLENLQGSMECLPSPHPTNARVIILDDVFTTGATFTEAERALRNAGFKHFVRVALAH